MIEADQRKAAPAQQRTSGAPDMLTRINSITISEDMLAYGANALAEMPEEKRNDFDQRMLMLIDTLKRHHPEAKISLAALAIDFRLRALARLIETTYVLGCEIDLVTRQPRVSAAALRAACHESLVRNAIGLASFDVATFKSRLLH